MLNTLNNLYSNISFYFNSIIHPNTSQEHSIARLARNLLDLSCLSYLFPSLRQHVTFTPPHSQRQILLNHSTAPTAPNISNLYANHSEISDGFFLLSSFESVVQKIPSLERQSFLQRLQTEYLNHTLKDALPLKCLTAQIAILYCFKQKEFSSELPSFCPLDKNTIRSGKPFRKILKECANLTERDFNALEQTILNSDMFTSLSPIPKEKYIELCEFSCLLLQDQKFTSAYIAFLNMLAENNNTARSN